MNKAKQLFSFVSAFPRVFPLSFTILLIEAIWIPLVIWDISNLNGKPITESLTAQIINALSISFAWWEEPWKFIYSALFHPMLSHFMMNFFALIYLELIIWIVFDTYKAWFKYNRLFYTLAVFYLSHILTTFLISFLWQIGLISVPVPRAAGASVGVMGLMGMLLAMVPELRTQFVQFPIAYLVKRYLVRGTIPRFVFRIKHIIIFFIALEVVLIGVAIGWEGEGSPLEPLHNFSAYTVSGIAHLFGFTCGWLLTKFVFRLKVPKWAQQVIIF